MNIFTILDGILHAFEVPFYAFMPEFAEGEDDSLFIVYNIYDNPAVFGDGAESVTRYNVTVSIFGYDLAQVRSLSETVTAALINEGFCRSGGTYSRNNDFPAYCRRSVDFEYCMECENT